MQFVGICVPLNLYTPWKITHCAPTRILINVLNLISRYRNVCVRTRVRGSNYSHTQTVPFLLTKGRLREFLTQRTFIIFQIYKSRFYDLQIFDVWTILLSIKFLNFSGESFFSTRICLTVVFFCWHEWGVGGVNRTEVCAILHTIIDFEPCIILLIFRIVVFKTYPDS